MELFEEIKQEILDRAHKAGACKEQYGRAYKSETIEGLCDVIKDNFNWCCNNSVLNGELIDKFKDVFFENKIFHNVSVKTGYLYASGSATVEAFDSATVEAFDSATVRASDSATVEAFDSATVRAFDSATVRASGSATVEAFGSATVRASDSATVEAFGSAYIFCHSKIECTLNDNAIVRRCDTNTIQYISNDLKFEKVESEEQ